MVSMKDIAAKCGYSVATVSKALNGQTDISEATREKIFQTANEMGYMINAAAKALKTKRTYNIGVLFIDEQNSGLTHEYFSLVLDSLKVEAENCGYDITFINKNIGNTKSSYLQHCRYRGVDGVIIACVDFKDPQVLELVSSEIPVVTIDHIFNNRISILSDNVNGMAALVRYAYECGHRRIAFIHGENTSVTENRLIGFYRACEDLGIEVPDEYVRSAAYHDTIRCEEETRELLSLAEPPTCILFPDDFSFIGGMNVIHEKNMRIPEDLSAAGYDGIRLSTMLSPQLTTYCQDTKELGRMAALKLVELIERPKTCLMDRIVVNGSLRIGGSIKKLTEG